MYMDIRIKDILKEKGLTMKDLSDNLGIAATSLSRSLNNNPTYDTLKKIAEALEVPFTDLFEQPKQNIITCPHCNGKIRVEKE